jgi:serine/threonine protein kinase/tetratricopeptide (TPR) repeat protein
MTDDDISGGPVRSEVRPDAESDEDFLDVLFESALRAASGDEEFDLDAAVSERPHLRGRAERLAVVADVVSIRRSRKPPQIPGFETLAELGRGSGGVVYLATQRDLSRPVALKVLAPAFAASRDGRARFRAEARALAKVRHPNVLPIYDVVDSGPACAYVMEWVEGGTFARLLESIRPAGPGASTDDVARALGGDPPSRSEPFVVFACRVAVAVARALGAVHRAGLVHRDVKPSNILLRQDGVPLLSDFGLVRDHEASFGTAAGEFVGTIAYAAPEQFSEDGARVAVDSRADIYGLGATLYSALAGRAPREPSGRNASTSASSPVSLDVLRPELSRDLRTIVATAMEPDVARRYSTADAFADDLERFLSFRPIRARPPTLLRRLQVFALRRRRSLVAAGAGAAATIVAAAVFGVGMKLENARRADLPRRAAAAVLEARMALLDRTNGERMFVLVEKNADREALAIGRTPADFGRALAAYDASLSFADDPAIREERRIVAEALDRIESSAGANAPGASRPSTASPGAADGVSSNPASDGLRAYLSGDDAAAIAAWRPLALSLDEPNPIVDAALGQLLLQRGEAGAAYPRLLRAVDAFPEAGFLLVDLADAAQRVGDAALGLEWVRRARRVGMLDPWETDIRVEAECLAALGDDVGARERFERMRHHHVAPNARLRYALWLESKGEAEEAATVAWEAYRVGPRSAPFRRAFERTFASWWSGAEESVRIEAIAEAIDRWGSRRGFLDDADAILSFSADFAAPTDAIAASRDRRPDFLGLAIALEISRMMPRTSVSAEARVRTARSALRFGRVLSSLQASFGRIGRGAIAAAALGLVLSLPVPASAQQSRFDFEFESTPGVLPTSVPNVGFGGGGFASPPWSIAPGCQGLGRLNTMTGPNWGTSYIYAGNVGSATTPATAFSFVGGLPVVMEMRLRVNSMVGAGFTGRFANGFHIAGFRLNAATSSLEDNTAALSTPFAPFTGVFHVVRVAYDPVAATYGVWIDGVQPVGFAAIPAGAASGSNHWLFGDGGGVATNNCYVDFDYFRIYEGAPGPGQANSYDATLSIVDLASTVETTGAAAGPHVVTLAANVPNAVALNWSGPALAPYVLLIGPPNPAGAFHGCSGYADIGTPPFYSDTSILVGGPFGPFAGVLLSGCSTRGTATLIATLPAFPPGTVVADVQGLIFQPSGCVAVLTAAFTLKT